MKRAAIITIEAASLIYMGAILWILFPGMHAPIAKGWRGLLNRWQLGRDQVRFAPMPLWLQEAAQVRGRYIPPEQAPRPLNLPL